MNKKNYVYKTFLAVVLMVLMLILPINMLSAQGATLDINALSEVPDNQTFVLNLNFNSPAELVSLTIVIDYDPTIVRFESIDSPYLSYDVEGSSETRLTLRTTGTIVPSGEIDLGSFEMLPLKIGNTRISVVSVSAFAAGDLIVRADATESHIVSVISGGNYNPIPSTTTVANTPITTANTEPVNTTTVSDPLITETLETTVEESIEETSPPTDSSSESSDTETTATEFSETNMSSTIAPETSTISSEPTVDETIEVDNTNFDDGDKDIVRNGFKIAIPIILLLLVASIITAALISRRK